MRIWSTTSQRDKISLVKGNILKSYQRHSATFWTFKRAKKVILLWRTKKEVPTGVLKLMMRQCRLEFPCVNLKLSKLELWGDLRTKRAKVRLSQTVSPLLTPQQQHLIMKTLSTIWKPINSKRSSFSCCKSSNSSQTSCIILMTKTTLMCNLKSRLIRRMKLRIRQPLLPHQAFTTCSWVRLISWKRQKFKCNIKSAVWQPQSTILPKWIITRSERTLSIWRLQIRADWPQRQALP